MELLLQSKITIPVGHMAVLIALNLLLFLLARYRLALFVTLCFTFYWSLVYNSDIMVTDIGAPNPLLLFSALGGFLFVLFTVSTLGSHHD